MFGYYNEAIEKGEYLLSLLGALKGHIHEARGIQINQITTSALILYLFIYLCKKDLLTMPWHYWPPALHMKREQRVLTLWVF